MRLSDHSAAFLYRERPGLPMHGGAISIIEGEVDSEAIVAHLADRIHLLPHYRQKLAFVPMNLAHPKWVDDKNFDFARHVFAAQLAAGSTLEAALQHAMELAESPLPRDRPLWAMYVIGGVQNRTVVVHLAHQSMAVSAAGVDGNSVLFDLQENASVSPVPWTPQPAPTDLALAVEAMSETSDQLMSAGRYLQNPTSERTELLRRATETLSRFVAEPVVVAPWNLSAAEAERNFCWRKYPFADIRRIRNVLGGTVNDVVITIVVEAAARYLASAGVAADGQHLRIMCPVDVRREDENGVRRNRVSAIFPVFGAERMDVTERLKEVRWETETIKQNREAQALRLMAELAPPTPPAIMLASQMVAAGLRPVGNMINTLLPLMPGFMPAPMVGFNFACTTIPGGQTKQYQAGHVVLDHLGFLPLGDSLGYGVTIMSYDQHLYVNMVSACHALPDPEVMAELLDSVFAELDHESRAATAA